MAMGGGLLFIGFCRGFREDVLVFLPSTDRPFSMIMMEKDGLN